MCVVLRLLKKPFRSAERGRTHREQRGSSPQLPPCGPPGRVRLAEPALPSPCGAGQDQAPEPMGLEVPAPPSPEPPFTAEGLRAAPGTHRDGIEHVHAEACLPGWHRAAPLHDSDTSSPASVSFSGAWGEHSFLPTGAGRVT